jgi:hypothetical protein
MKPQELYWSICNTVDMRRADGLTFEQARFIASIIPPSERDHWSVWYEGLDMWCLLDDSEILLDEGFIQGLTSAPVPPVNPNAKPGELTGAQPDQHVRIDRRVTRRFLKTFRVDIYGPKKKRHITKTVNLSASGMLLEDHVPDEFGKSFRCKITRKSGQTLEVFCAVVRPDDPGGRTRIKFLDISQPKVLMSWLIDVLIE